MREWTREYLDGGGVRDHVLTYTHTERANRKIIFKFGPGGIGTHLKMPDPAFTFFAEDLAEILLDAADIQQEILNKNDKL